jgi:aminoglycoside phosphotransferase family enzyme/predicted kinase
MGGWGTEPSADRFVKAMTFQQDDIFKAMADPDFYPHPVEEVRQRETHISRVFLTGEFVYKVKKEVNLGFVDYSSLEKRHYFCRQETDLNRRLSSGVYLGVVPITHDHDRFALGGTGVPVEHTVKMRQLTEAGTMLRQLQAHKIGSAEIEALARRLADFYAATAGSPEIDFYGSLETVRRNCEENFTQVEGFLGNALEERPFQIVRAATWSFLQRKRWLFENRVANGRIRDCHGDLRSGHIYFDNGIQIVDCIEFNDRFRYGDIVSDLAFLAMDLDFEGFPEAARELVDAVVRGAADPDAFALLDFYKCYRAMVRTKVSCLRLSELGPGEYAYHKTRREAGQFLALAYRYALQFTKPLIWVVCGLPASGKSTIADALGEILGLEILRSDVIRKQLFDLPAETAVIQPFEEGIYSREVTALTYGRLLLQAQDRIAAGQSVILDATYGSSRQRQEVLRLAQDSDADVLFIECVARPDMLIERLRRRENGISVSDAREQHFRQLQERFEPLEDIREELHLRVDTEEPIHSNLNRILSHDNLPPPKATSV